MKKILVYYDEGGKILATLEVVGRDANLPSISIIPEKDHRVSEIELIDDLANMPPVDLHNKYKVDIKQTTPKLMPAE
jgi:hypothetical protein